MKYVTIFIIVVILVRIDIVLVQYDKLKSRFSRTATVDPGEVRPSRDMIPFSEDLSVKQSPRKIFFSLLNDFRTSPSEDIKQRAIELLRKQPGMFGSKLDRALETEIFRWRDLLYNNDPQIGPMLVELSNILEGENLNMLKNFFSIWMDINMENFLKAYSQTRDTNCSVASTFGDSVIAEEKNNILFDREKSLAEFLLREKTNIQLKAYATNCQLVLNLYLAKVVPKAEYSEENLVKPEL